MRNRLCTALGMMGATALLSVSAPSAYATSLGTVSGNETKKCSAQWDAVTIFDADKKVNPADVSSVYTDDVEKLWKDPSGNPIKNYENGGYVKEASGLFGDPGRFEIQHFSFGSNEIVLRYFIGTDYAMDDAKLALELPELPSGSTDWKFETSTFGADYSAKPGVDLPYTTPYTQYDPTPDANGVVHLGDVPAYSAVTLMAVAKVPAENFNDSYIAKGTLTGGYGTDDACPLNPIPAPETPAKKVCEVNLWGQTVRGTRARDVEARDKWDDNGFIHLTHTYADKKDDETRTSPAPLGEVNADSWEDATTKPVFRLYGATEKPLKGVTYTAVAPQGVTFDQTVAAFYTADGKNMGQVFKSGYVQKVDGVTGPTVSPDGKKITLKIDSMPAKSGFAFVVNATTDKGADKIVINSALNGKEEGCDPSKPTDPTLPAPVDPTRSPRPTKSSEPTTVSTQPATTEPTASGASTTAAAQSGKTAGKSLPQDAQSDAQKQKKTLANTGISSMTLVWAAVGLAAVIGGAVLLRRKPRSDR